MDQKKKFTALSGVQEEEKKEVGFNFDGGRCEKGEGRWEMEDEGQKNRSLMRPIFLPEVKLIKQRSIEAVVSEPPQSRKAQQA